MLPAPRDGSEALYELLTGSLPFTTPDPVELVFSHLARQPLPPHEVEPSIPVPLSDLVMKLLSKAAEDRYQSAHGIKADLEACLAQLVQRGTVTPFPLARRDHGTELHLSQELYGRQLQVAALAAAVQRARAGAAELFLVLGQGGVGKSALVHEVQRSATRLHPGALFATGRHEPLSRTAPHAALAQALRELCQQLLTTSREECARWREALAVAVGNSGHLITDRIPELEFLLGPMQQQQQQLGPVESQSRLGPIFRELVQVFTARARPLILFLDDVQRADAATLELLRGLLTDLQTDPPRGHLLLILAYRDNEVGPGHPLSAMLAELRRTDVSIHEAYLPALTVPDIAELVRDSLGCEPARGTELAHVLYEKTHGNPYSLNQFLLSLHQEGLLHFDYAVESWQFSLADIQSRQVTSNVVEFLAARIRLQPPRTQRALMRAACIGYQFELSTLSALCGLSPLETAEALWPALREGLCLPLDGEYRVALSADPLGDPLATCGDGRELDLVLQTAYRFPHERVRQAAGSLLPPDELPGVHLLLARRLRAQGAGTAEDDALLDLVGHYNRGSRDLTDASERREVARLNLAAGQRAKAASAFLEASAYLQAGVALLASDCFTADYELAFRLHIELAECSYRSGQLDRADELFELLEPRLRSDLDRARVATLQVKLYATRGRVAQALAVGLAALERLGVVLPRAADEQAAALALVLAELKRLLADRALSELLALPAADSDELLVLQRLLLTTCSPALSLSPDLFSLLALQLAVTSLRHGHTRLSASGYAAYAVIAANVLGRYAEAHAFGQLALELDRRIGDGALTCKLHCLTAALVNPYVLPLRQSLTSLRAGLSAGLESGDFAYVGSTCHHIAMLLLGTGEELGAVRHELDRLWALASRTREQPALRALTVSRQVVLNLCAQTSDRGSLSSPGFDEESFVADLRQGELTALLLWYFIQKLQLGLLYGDLATAARAAAEAHRRAHSGLGLHCLTDLYFFTALTHLRSPPPGASAAMAQVETEDLPPLEALCEKLERWAAASPESYRHKTLLIAAERARVRGQPLEALALYDQAIAQATQNEFVHHAALANELCARSLLEQKRPRLAAFYLQEAAHAYKRWGATAKLAQLHEEFPSLRTDPGAVASAAPAVTASSRVLSTGALDVAAVVGAAQSITSEIVLERLLAELLRSVATSAGAQRGVLLLDRDGRLLVEGTIATDPDRIQVGQALPIEQCPDVARSIVQLVAHTREAVVLGRASRDPRFAGDPYIQAHRPKSLLCLALKHRGRLSGVVYLENNTAEDVFTADRLELLRLLSGQAAIALENAGLYARLQEVTDQLTDINEELVRANTELLRHSDELRRANDELVFRTAELRAANARTEHELAERARIEHERATLQEEVIRMQRARLAELAAPLIPLSSDILVLPLVGTIDGERAQHILHTLLDGVQRARARVIILDITGMEHIDTRTAGTLIQAAGALRLLGAQAVLTGIRAEVAQVLVSLGIELGALVTRGTLQSGIAYARDVLSRQQPGPPQVAAPDGARSR